MNFAVGDVLLCRNGQHLVVEEIVLMSVLPIRCRSLLIEDQLVYLNTHGRWHYLDYNNSSHPFDVMSKVTNFVSPIRYTKLC